MVAVDVCPALPTALDFTCVSCSSPSMPASVFSGAVALASPGLLSQIKRQSRRGLWEKASVWGLLGRVCEGISWGVSESEVAGGLSVRGLLYHTFRRGLLYQMLGGQGHQMVGWHLCLYSAGLIGKVGFPFREAEHSRCWSSFLSLLSVTTTTCRGDVMCQHTWSCTRPGDL